jgi:murein DD-endopeptidase MepM/ murein hydrolase activator NlpD
VKAVKSYTYLNLDYKADLTTAKRKGTGISRLHWLLLLSGIIIPGLFLVLNSNDAGAIKSATSSQLEEISRPGNTFPLELPTLGTPSQENSGAGLKPDEPVPAKLTEKPVTVKKGDTLSKIFSKLDLDQRQLFKVMESGKDTKYLKRMMPGQHLTFTIADNNELHELTYKINRTESLHVTNDGSKFNTQLVTKELEKRITQSTGTISSSLFLAGQEAGLSDELIMELANVFAWDVDFALDIRKDDHFSMVYEELYLDGKKVGTGNILAADFSNQGKTYRALRYTTPDGRTDYFTPEGRSMRKAFLRSPVDFRRISSRFTGQRYHPVLGKKRPHRGVDYAAATGTPIKAAGDGKVSFKGRKGGYGRAVIIQHGTQYSTLYAHMSSYARGIRNGKSVKQGQTIGYVGKSGLATGPHLHYEFRLNGAHRNPLTVKLPNAEPLDKKYIDNFKIRTNGLVAQLNLLQRPMMAENSF